MVQKNTKQNKHISKKLVIAQKNTYLQVFAAFAYSVVHISDKRIPCQLVVGLEQKEKLRKKEPPCFLLKMLFFLCSL